MIGILKTLVELPTITGEHAPAVQAFNYIEDYLSSRGMQVERPQYGDYESLVATVHGSKTPKVMLSAHLDVVPATTDMLELREVDGKFYGRGVYDMKFAIASYLHLVDQLKGHLSDYDFGIMITSDEETGGLYGTKSLVDDGYIPEFCVLPDGGENWQLQLSSKGFLYLQITAEGKTAHGSRPWLGKNAILTLMDVVADIRDLFPPSGPDTNTYNIGEFRGGEAVNQVAQRAECFLDIRLIGEDDRQRILHGIQQSCNRHGAQLTVKLNGAATNFSLDEPYLAAFAAAITEVTGITVTGSTTLGSNDTRYLSAAGVPCASLYIVGGDHHGPNEWIDHQSLLQFNDVLELFIMRMARSEVASPVTEGNLLTVVQ